MYKLNDLAKRSTFFAAAVSLLAGVATTALPAFASADALNPLTERSLTLSSSSPGYHFLDGSGNALYSPAGSGNNGKKTGEVLTFKVSSTATVKAITWQFCTTPAGACLSPGDNYAATVTNVGTGAGVDHTNSDSNNHTDLDTVFPSPSQGTVAPSSSQHSSTDNFQIFTDAAQGQVGSNVTAASDWAMTLANKEDAGSFATNAVTGKKNFITFSSATGQAMTAGEVMSISLYGTDTNYITNPGSGAFFVKVNTFSSDTVQNTAVDTPTSGQPATIIDGGVTVANVMNDSIQITTKVLETMSFSVGTTNPDADSTLGSHGTCDSISHNDPIELGDTAAEFSLSTTQAYDGYSYWRLSSNSSNGATVYYSGYTLHNTENDRIKSIFDTSGGHVEGDGSKMTSHLGTEQFGLAIEDPGTDDTDGAHAGGDTLASGATSLGALTPLVSETAYADGAGHIQDATTPAKFAFKDSSLYQPEPIATEASTVIHCSTAKMRYVANIAPDTPAGIYTSKINYIAAPQY